MSSAILMSRVTLVNQAIAAFRSEVTRIHEESNAFFQNGNGLTCPAGTHLDSTAYKMTPPYRVAS
ncbi:unnamed protein product, partial [Strongylus vulgaris]